MSDQLALFEVPEPQDPGSIALSELLDAYDPVAAYAGPDPFIVVAERGDGEQARMLAEVVSAGPELGYSSPSPWTAWTREEHNNKLRDKLGITEYYRMKRVDGIIRGTLRMFKTPVLSAHWFIEPGNDTVRAKNVAERVQKNLEEELNVSWFRVLEDILLMCDYGYMVMEKVFQQMSDGWLGLRKLAPRHPADIRHFNYDRHGGPSGIVMEPLAFDGDPAQGIPIGIEKLVIFALEAEAGDLRGISILRSAYKHYVYKDTLYKIDAIQKERHGIGVPVIKMPPGWKKADKDLAEKIGRNLRTNERAHITLPPNWEIYFAELEGQPVNCLDSIDHHNMMIMANVLAPFLTTARTKKDNLELFFKGTRYIAETVTDTMNRHVVRQLVDMNYSRVPYPSMRVRRIGEWEDQRTQSFTLRNYVGAGLIRPDDQLEGHLRREMDLPPVDEETIREQVKPQQPGAPSAPEARAPRQTAPSAQPPRANGGTDKSGG